MYSYIYIYMYTHTNLYKHTQNPTICSMGQGLLKVHGLQNQNYYSNVAPTGLATPSNDWTPDEGSDRRPEISAGARTRRNRGLQGGQQNFGANIVLGSFEARPIVSVPSRHRRRSLSVRLSCRPSPRRRPSSVRLSRRVRPVVAVAVLCSSVRPVVRPVVVVSPLSVLPSGKAYTHKLRSSSNFRVSSVRTNKQSCALEDEHHEQNKAVDG